MTVRYWNVNSPSKPWFFFFFRLSCNGFTSWSLNCDQLLHKRSIHRDNRCSHISVTVITFSNRKIITSFCLRATKRYPLFLSKNKIDVLTKQINWTDWGGKRKPDWGQNNNHNKPLNKWLTLDWVLAFFRAVLYFSASSNALFNLQQQKKKSHKIRRRIS